MKSFFKSLLALVAVGMMSAACADPTMDSYLYWMLDDTSVVEGTTYAKIKWLDNESGDGYLVNANYGAKAGEENFYPDFTLGQYAQIGSTMLNDNYRFIVELYNDDGKLSSLNAVLGSWIKGSTGSDVLSITGNAANMAVPEPTSGMLALLGFGLMALRRKQKKA